VVDIVRGEFKEMSRFANVNFRALTMWGLWVCVMFSMIMLCFVMVVNGVDYSFPQKYKGLTEFNYFDAKFKFEVLNIWIFQIMITFYIFVYPLLPQKNLQMKPCGFPIGLSLSLPISSKEFVNKRFITIIIASTAIILLFLAVTMIGLNTDRSNIGSTEKIAYLRVWILQIVVTINIVTVITNTIILSTKKYIFPLFITYLSATLIFGLRGLISKRQLYDYIMNDLFWLAFACGVVLLNLICYFISRRRFVMRDI